MEDAFIAKFTLNDLVGAVDLFPKNLGAIVLKNGNGLKLKKPIKGKIFRRNSIPYITIDSYPDSSRKFFSDKESCTYHDLFNAVIQELYFTYGEYGFVKNSRLSRDAIMLKKWINQHVCR